MTHFVSLSPLSPRRGFSSALYSSPWLAPWAVFFRRFAAAVQTMRSKGPHDYPRVRLSKITYYPIDNIMQA
jgi:hypothetical protein